jgi:hypothetical protein
MSTVNVGDRIVIAGIQARPQLNGMYGTVTGRAPNGRLTVRLENLEQETVALKPPNLTVVGSTSGGGGGGSSGGGSSGGGGGGGGGSRVPGVGGLLAAATALAEQLRDQVRMMVPLPQVRQLRPFFALFQCEFSPLLVPFWLCFLLADHDSPLQVHVMIDQMTTNQLLGAHFPINKSALFS